MSKLSLVLALFLTLVMPVHAFQSPDGQSGSGGKPAAKPADKPAPKMPAEGEAPPPLEQTAMGLSLFAPSMYKAAKGEPGMFHLATRAELLASVETCLKSKPEDKASKHVKADHQRFTAHADATRKIFAAIETIDGAPVKYLIPELKPWELPLGFDHLTADEKSDSYGLLVSVCLEAPADASKTTPVDRMKRLARDVALPCCAKLAPNAKEFGLEQIGLVLLQPCRDPSVQGKDETKSELALFLFPLADLEKLAKKELDEKAVLAKATAMFMGRGDKKLAKSDALRE